MANANREKRREQILEGLFQAMAHRQADSVSISDIAGAANIARGALHYYFESKDEIRACLMQKLGQSYIANLRNHLDNTSPEHPADQVEKLIQFHFRPSRSQHVADLMAVWIEFWGQAASDQTLNEVVLMVQENARKICLEVALHTHPQLQTFADGALREVSATILALIEGGLLQWRVALKTKAPLDQERLADGITLALRAYLSSLVETSASSSMYQLRKVAS